MFRHFFCGDTVCVIVFCGVAVLTVPPPPCPPHYRVLRHPLFWNSDVGSFTFQKIRQVKALRDETYRFSSSCHYKGSTFFSDSKDLGCCSGRGSNPRPSALGRSALSFLFWKFFSLRSTRRVAATNRFVCTGKFL